LRTEVLTNVSVVQIDLEASMSFFSLELDNNFIFLLIKYGLICSPITPVEETNISFSEHCKNLAS